MGHSHQCLLSLSVPEAGLQDHSAAFDKQAYGQITSICQTAIGIEPFDEEFHYHLVYSLYKDGHTSQALEEYSNTLDLFYNEFSISPTEHFKELYNIIRNSERGINTNLDSIQTSLNEESSGGAFYCEYPIFRDLFQLERRSIQRTGDSIYLLPADCYRDRRKNSKEHDPSKSNGTLKYFHYGFPALQ